MTNLKVCDRAALQKFIGSRWRFLYPPCGYQAHASKFGGIRAAFKADDCELLDNRPSNPRHTGIHCAAVFQLEPERHENASPARACGIDFGTSNSTVGWLRPGMETLIALEDDKITLPSVVFFNLEERRPVYGRLALHEYLEGYEGRLMRSLKSLLGSKLIKHDTSVLGTAMPFKDLLGLFIGQLKKRAEATAGREFEEVVLGRPVFSSTTMKWPTRKRKTPWWTSPAPSVSRRFRSSTSPSRRHSTMNRPSRKKSWC